MCRRRIQTENVEAPGGRIVRGPTEVGSAPWAALSESTSSATSSSRTSDGAPIRVRDVGYAEDGMAEKRTFAYYKASPP